MEIQKLKKQLLREELKRRNKKSGRPLRTAIAAGILAILLGGWIYTTMNLEKRLESRFAEADAMVARGEYDLALSTYRGIYEKHPDFHLAPQALYRTGEILDLFRQQYHEALLAYLLVEKDYPQSDAALQARRRAAEIYKLRIGDHSQAIVAYQKLVDDGVADADRLQYEVADSYFRLNNFEQARIEFESLLKNFPDSPLVPEVRYRIADIYALEGSSLEAEGAFRAMIGQWPESPYAIEAQFGLAAVLEERDELLAALEILQRLEGKYRNPEALERKMIQVRERIRTKKKAI